MLSALKSWKTTTAAAVFFLALFFGEIKKEVDDKPETKADWNQIVEGISIFAIGLFARDSNKSSENVGAK